jgi:ribosomal protein S18 acetylase RimI-like enzyme
VSIEVSPARPEEYELLGDALVAAYAGLRQRLRPEYAAELRRIADRVADPHAVVLAVRVDGRPVGCATVVLGPSEEWAPHGVQAGEAWLRMVGVEPSQAGRGAGRALVTAALEVARERGLAWMRLYTQPDMLAAQHIYRSLGFRRVPERDTDVVGGEIHLLGYEISLPTARSERAF